MEGIATGINIITTKKLKRKEEKSHEACGRMHKTKCECRVQERF